MPGAEGMGQGGVRPWNADGGCTCMRAPATPDPLASSLTPVCPDYIFLKPQTPPSLCFSTFSLTPDLIKFWPGVVLTLCFVPLNPVPTPKHTHL